MSPGKIPFGKIPMQRGQIEANIQLFRAKAQIQRQMLETMMERSLRERRLVLEFCHSQGFGVVQGTQKLVLDQYLAAKQAEDKAQEDAQRVNLKELESQVTIWESTLANAESKIADPGNFKV
jgi:hypothetical protein